MVIGLGIDLVELSRIGGSLNRYGDRFCRKLLHADELRNMPAMSAPPGPRLIEWIGGRFAAKEAAFKALGTGMANGIGLHDIRIQPDAAGKPGIHLYGMALDYFDRLQARTVHLSITHTAGTAAAVVVLSR